MIKNKPQALSAISEHESEFHKMFSGKFYGVLRWHQLDELWALLKKGDDRWYIYAVGETPPLENVKKEKLHEFIEEIDRLLRREHNEDYCGIVYANSLSNPSFIKIFDPSNLGTSCSIATKGPLPSWILSQLKPSELVVDVQQTKSRKRWWQKLFKK